MHQTNECLMRGHDDLVVNMHQLGYRTDNEGMCRGLAMMGLQAFLSRDLATFDKRISTFRAQSDNRVIQSIDLSAFFDGVALYFQPEAYSELFGKTLTQRDIVLISDKVASDRMVEQGGLVCIESRPCIYSHVEYLSYLNILAYAAKRNETDLAFILSTYNHSIFLGYDAQKQVWILIDPNRLPSQTISRAEALLKLFDEDGYFDGGLFCV